MSARTPAAVSRLCSMVTITVRLVHLACADASAKCVFYEMFHRRFQRMDTKMFEVEQFYAQLNSESVPRLGLRTMRCCAKTSQLS